MATLIKHTISFFALMVWFYPVLYGCCNRFAGVHGFHYQARANNANPLVFEKAGVYKLVIVAPDIPMERKMQEKIIVK